MVDLLLPTEEGGGTGALIKRLCGVGSAGVPAFPLEFEHGRAVAVGVEHFEDLTAAPGELGFEAPRPTVVVVGGAAGLDDSQAKALEPLAIGIVEAAAACGAVIVDGGTDAGIMRLVGVARARTGASFPLVGVVVRALAGLPGQPLEGEMAPLDPRHTHFVLVPGATWGEEALWLARVAGVLSVGQPSVTVLVNGGEIAWKDVALSVRAGRRVLTVAGTGRTADALARAVSGEEGDTRAAELVESGLVEAVGPDPLVSAIVERRIVRILSQSGSADVV